MGLFDRFRKHSAPSTNESGSLRVDLIVPMLSGQAWMEANEAIFAGIPDFPMGDRPYAKPIADGLYVTYAVDPGPSWEIVSTDAVHAFGDADALHKIAIANLRQRGDAQIEGTDGKYRLTMPTEQDLSASLLLDPDRWRHVLPITGDLVIAVPARGELLVCGVDDGAAILSLGNVAAHSFETHQSKPVSPALYQWSHAGLSILPDAT